MRRGAPAMPALALALALALASIATPAWAHASLVSSTPAAGERFGERPASVGLEFSEAMTTPAYVVVTAPDGRRADEGEVRVEDRDVVVDLATGDLDGTYSVAFRVVSVDGHPVTGRFSFVVGDGPLEQQVPAERSVAGSDTEDAGQASGKRAVAVRAEDNGPSLARVQALVAAGLFVVAGVLLLASRRGARRT